MTPGHSRYEAHTPVARYYDDLAAQHGPTPGAADAISQESLDLRYRALADTIDMNGRRVLEVGCGHGGLGAYLSHRYPAIDYRGIDLSPKLIELGRRTHPGLRIVNANVTDLPETKRYDLVLAQGIFYKLGRDAWHKTLRLIDKMWTLTDQTLAFTALTTWNSQERQPDEYRVYPPALLKHLHTLTPFISLRHDYHEADGLFVLNRLGGATVTGERPTQAESRSVNAAPAANERLPATASKSNEAGFPPFVPATARTVPTL